MAHVKNPNIIRVTCLNQGALGSRGPLFAEIQRPLYAGLSDVGGRAPPLSTQQS